MMGRESIRHRLALAVRVDDHFSGQPASQALSVTLDDNEAPLALPGGAGCRHADGTYRFLEPTRAGVRQVRVAGAQGFTWADSTVIGLPLASAAAPLVIEFWPSANAVVPAGTLAIRGRLAGAASPGQEVRIEATGMPLRNRRTRADADLEFLFVVLGAAKLNAMGKVGLTITTPGLTVQSIAIREGDQTTTTPGGAIAVQPGREHRAVITLTT
jgi:hypothetical protein